MPTQDERVPTKDETAGEIVQLGSAGLCALEREQKAPSPVAGKRAFAISRNVFTRPRRRQRVQDS